MTCFYPTKTTFHGRLSCRILIALAALSIMFAATTANACANPAATGSPVAIKLPFLAQANSGGQKPSSSDSIVGLWYVNYTAGGQPFYDAYDLWHGDHTEFENADLSPIEGNICMGAWKKVGARTVQLNHVGFSFDNNGNPNGTFTLAETNTVSKDGATYQGTFDYKLFDSNGTLLQEVTGTVAATRITAD